MWKAETYIEQLEYPFRGPKNPPKNPCACCGCIPKAGKAGCGVSKRNNGVWLCDFHKNMKGSDKYCKCIKENKNDSSKCARTP